MIILFEEPVGTFDRRFGHTLAIQFQRFTILDDEIICPCSQTEAEAKNHRKQMLHVLSVLLDAGGIEFQEYKQQDRE